MSAPRWTSSALGKKLRANMVCVSASKLQNTPGRTWGQFMPVRYTSDKNGPKQGVPYDALQTILDGKGKWWEGMDPVDLYGPVHNNRDPLHSPFANQFMWRVDDAISKYHPDVIGFASTNMQSDSQMDFRRSHGTTGFPSATAGCELLQQVPQVEPWKNGRRAQSQGGGRTLQQLPK